MASVRRPIRVASLLVPLSSSRTVVRSRLRTLHPCLGLTLHGDRILVNGGGTHANKLGRATKCRGVPATTDALTAGTGMEAMIRLSAAGLPEP
jgi:hypothetical protein